jgi:uncharacterized membrane protein YgcG
LSDNVKPCGFALLQVAELLAGVTAPVLYWEQGHEWIFGDPIRLQVSSGSSSSSSCSSGGSNSSSGSTSGGGGTGSGGITAQ